MPNMRNNWKNSRGMEHSAFSCVCPTCGYSTPHTSGVPCLSMKCPRCGESLMRSDRVEVHPAASTQVLQENARKSDKPFPQIHVDLCTGCGICVSSCPTDAIVLLNGKAHIEEEACRNCRKCVRVCPSGAIV